MKRAARRRRFNRDHSRGHATAHIARQQSSIYVFVRVHYLPFLLFAVAVVVVAAICACSRFAVARKARPRATVVVSVYVLFARKRGKLMHCKNMVRTST